jgi:putative ABC transport system permease protein
VGAKNRHIMGQFILESFLIIGLGAAIGFLIAIVLIKIVSMFPIEEYVGHPVLNIQVALISMFVLGIIGFMAGFFPARKATKLDPVECLRY